MIASFKKAFAALAAVSTLGVAAATTAQAQNYNLNPAYGTFSLSAGFSNDPRTATGRAGGDNRREAMPGCPNGGWFASAPDFRLHYQAGSFPLTFYVTAPGDTMLLINAPDTSWHCNDDSDGLNPAVRFANPPSGQYDVWIGTYGRDRVYNTTVYVTELR